MTGGSIPAGAVIGIFFFSTAFRLSLKHNQPPVQCVWGALFPSSKVKWLGHEADLSPPSSAKVKNVWSYTSTPPIHLDGVVLS
jgi:hypothetical protein